MSLKISGKYNSNGKCMGNIINVKSFIYALLEQVTCKFGLVLKMLLL